MAGGPWTSSGPWTLGRGAERVASERPRARGGLLATDHSKRGRRFVTVLDPDSGRVTLLEAWEHAALVLCDGQRDASTIAELLALDTDEPLDAEVIERCFKFFERQALIEPLGLRRSDVPPPGPRTMAQLQSAYAEWHKEPVRTGQLPAWLDPGFVSGGPPPRPELGPTVAVPGVTGATPRPSRSPARTPVAVGSTLVFGDGASVLIDSSPSVPMDDEGTDGASTDVRGRAVLRRLEAELQARGDADDDEVEGVLDVLRAVDAAVSEADALEAARSAPEPGATPAPLPSPVIRRAPLDNAEAQLKLTMVAPPARAPSPGPAPLPDRGSARTRMRAWAGEDDHTLEAVAARPPSGRRPRRPRSPTAELAPPVAPSVGDDRARTVSTGARPPPQEARALFDRLVRASAGEATVSEAVGLLDPTDLGDALAHLRRLLARVPGRATTALVRALERASDPSIPTRAAPPRRAERPLRSGLRALAVESAEAGRCAACLSRVGSGSRRCTSCGFEPEGLG
jgi:hypothetical protein